jgi:protein subunit release factor B
MKQRGERVIHLTKKDFVEQTFRAGGKGGQKQNKTSSGVRIIHPPSGARGESRTETSQAQNRKKAFRRMAESDTFQRWIRLEHARKVGAIEAAVDDAMRPGNLLIEYGPFDDEDDEC